MILQNKLKFIVTLLWVLSFEIVAQAQEASEKTASELYTNAGLHRHGVKPVIRPTSPLNDAKNLPSSQRVITTPKRKNETNPTHPVTPYEGIQRLPSNKVPVNPKYNRQRQLTKPTVPEEGS